MPTVDVHAHVGVRAVDALIEGQPGLARQREVDAATLGRDSLAVNLEQLGEIGPKLVDIELRLRTMDAARVQVQAVSPLPLPHARSSPRAAVRVSPATPGVAWSGRTNGPAIEVTGRCRAVAELSNGTGG